MLQVPALANRDPIEVFLSLSKLAEVTASLNLERDCAKYYWWTVYGENPYEAAKDTSFMSAYSPKAVNKRRLWGKLIFRRTYAPTRAHYCCECHLGGDKPTHILIKNSVTRFTWCIEQIEGRDDWRLLRDVVEGLVDPHLQDSSSIPRWFTSSEKLVKTYLMARACDLARYGQAVADRTFPQPSLKSTAPWEVAEMISRLVTVLEKLERIPAEKEEKAWLAGRQKMAQDAILRYFENKRICLPDHLPPRVLSTDEREELRRAYLTVLRQGEEAVWRKAIWTVIDEFVEFCWLLSQPENHIKIPGTQYVETQVNTYTTQEMTNQMARELIDLPRFTVYAKVIQEQGGVQVVRKAKIKTDELPKVPQGGLPEASRIARQNAIDSGILRPRRAIEAESRSRQARWRRRALEQPPPPSEEPPPNRPSRSLLDRTPPTSEEPPPSQARSIAAPKHEEPPPTYSPPKNIPEKRSRSRAPARTDNSSPDLEEQSSADTEGNKLPKPEEPPSSVTPPTLQLVSLEFFESGKDVPKMEERQYNTRFPLSTARFINYEITLHNLLYKQGDQTRQWEVRYYNPDGTLEGTNQDGNFVTQSDCKTFCHSGGRGRAQPGHWKPGTYRVIIVIDGSEFAEGSFTIDEPPQIAMKPLPTSDLRVERLTFYESDEKNLLKEQRSYRFWFPQDTTRFVNYEITVDNRLYKHQDQTYQVVVRYYNTDGSLWLTDDPRDWVITSDMKQALFVGGRGWSKPGEWKPGDYRVEILINGVEFAETKFKIQKPRRRRRRG